MSSSQPLDSAACGYERADMRTLIHAIALKEIRQLRRDRLTFGMIIGIPLMQMLLFGYAINFDVRNLRAGVLDEANTTASRALIADLQASGVARFDVHSRSSAELAQSMQAGRITLGVHIPPDFERRRLDGDRPVAQVIVDGSQPGLENIARGLNGMRLPGRNADYGQERRLFEIRTEYNLEKRTATQIVPALIGVILSMTMMMFTAVAIVREREHGNLELLITTPVTALELMLGKLLPYVFIGLTQVTLVLILGSVLFHVPIRGDLSSLYLAALIFIGATLSIGLLISTLARNQTQAFQMSLFLLLPSILLSGFVFPFDGMPRAVQWLAQILPLTHFVDLIRGIILRGASLSDLQPPLYKLLALSAVVLLAVTLRFRKRLD
jgi:ABC-2 type transport system permease protein